MYTSTRSTPCNLFHEDIPSSGGTTNMVEYGQKAIADLASVSDYLDLDAVTSDVPTDCTEPQDIRPEQSMTEFHLFAMSTSDTIIPRSSKMAVEESDQVQTRPAVVLDIPNEEASENVVPVNRSRECPPELPTSTNVLDIDTDETQQSGVPTEEVSIHLGNTEQFVASGFRRGCPVNYGNNDDLCRTANEFSAVESLASGIVLHKARDKLVIRNGCYTKGLQYTEIRKLGQGGQGHVYVARDLTSSELFCIKKFRHNLGRFRPEEVLAMVKCIDEKGICQVYGAIKEENDGDVMILMEYLKGPPLYTWANDPRNYDKMGLKPFLDLFMQLLDILIVLKSKNILHGDIKALNLVVTEGDNVPKLNLIDFGLAHFPPVPKSVNLSGSYTHLSPEKARSQPHSFESDVYAACTTLYEMLVGSHPYYDSADCGFSIIFKVGKYGPPFDKLPSWFPNEVNELFLKGWEKDAEQRATAEDLRDTINSLLHREDNDSDPDDGPDMFEMFGIAQHLPLYSDI